MKEAKGFVSYKMVKLTATTLPLTLNVLQIFVSFLEAILPTPWPGA